MEYQPYCTCDDCLKTRFQLEDIAISLIQSAIQTSRTGNSYEVFVPAIKKALLKAPSIGRVIKDIAS